MLHRCNNDWRESLDVTVTPLTISAFFGKMWHAACFEARLKNAFRDQRSREMNLASFQTSARPLCDSSDGVDLAATNSVPIDLIHRDEAPSGASTYSHSWTTIVIAALYSPATWALIVAVGLVDWVWLRNSRLSFGGWRDVGYIIVFMWALGVLGSIRGIAKLADLGHHLAMWVAFLAVNIVFTYLWATLPMPLHDAAFARINTALGFNWSAWYLWILARTWPRTLLSAAYDSLLLQILGSVSYLALTDRPDRNRELLWTVMLSALCSAVVSGLLPAIGPFIPGSPPPFSVALVALRSGTLSHIDVSQLKGIVTMPSFHTTLAILFTYAHRPPSRSFIPVLMLNLVMLIAIPFAGHHYVIDMLAGAALAAVSIAMVRAAGFAASPSLASTAPSS
jgi:hypothetical protein